MIIEAFCLQQGKLATRTHIQFAINESIRQTQFSSFLKEAYTTSVFKKDRAQNAIHYTPICATDMLSKVFERLLLKLYIEHLKHNSLLEAYQFRVQENESAHLQ